MALSEGTYVAPLRYDMSDSQVEALVSEVEGLFIEEFERRSDELENPGIVDEVVNAVINRTSWSRSSLQTPLRRAARQLGKRVDSIQSKLVVEEDGE